MSGPGTRGRPRTWPLVRTRVAGLLRTGRVLAPAIATLVAVGVLYGGGAPPADEAYGVSAVLLFPILAWQSKLLLDTEPDDQRRLMAVAAGSRVRELVAGLGAAMLVAVASIVVAMVAPWLVGGVRVAPAPDAPGLVEGLAVGAWAHLIAVPGAVALGALASRVVTRTAGRGVIVLAAGAVLSIVLGLDDSPAPWLAPAGMATARAIRTGLDPAGVTVLTAYAVAWAAALLVIYAWLRRSRA